MKQRFGHVVLHGHVIKMLNGSGDIMAFVCYVTWQDHVMKMLNDFMVMSHARHAIILSSLVAIGMVAVQI